MTFELEEMNRIQKVSWETPEKDFMLVPYYIVGQKLRLKMVICMRRLEEEKEVEEDEAEDEAEEEYAYYHWKD